MAQDFQTPGLRRSQRVTTQPKYLEDYVLFLAEEEGERLLMCLNNEPRNFEEAKSNTKNGCRHAKMK